MRSRWRMRWSTPARNKAMDLRKLKTLIDLVQQSGIAELEITEGEEKVRISRGVPGNVHAAPAPVTYYTNQPAPQAPPEGPAAPPAEAAAPQEPEGHLVKSPMV